MAELVARRARSGTSGSARRRRRRSGALTPCTRSPRCRPSTRCGRATRRPRSCRPAASWASASSRTRHSDAASSPGASSRRTSSTRTTSGATARASPARTCAANLQLAARSTRSPRERRHAAQLALAWVLRAGRRPRADPRHQAARVPRGERRRGRRRADRATSSRGSRPSCPRSQANATTRLGWARSTAEPGLAGSMSCPHGHRLVRQRARRAPRRG